MFAIGLDLWTEWNTVTKWGEIETRWTKIEFGAKHSDLKRILPLFRWTSLNSSSFFISRIPLLVESGPIHWQMINLPVTQKFFNVFYFSCRQFSFLTLIFPQVRFLCTWVVPPWCFWIHLITLGHFLVDAISFAVSEFVLWLLMRVSTWAEVTDPNFLRVSLCLKTLLVKIYKWLRQTRI